MSLLGDAETSDGGEDSSPLPTGYCIHASRRSRWPRLRCVADKTSNSKPLQRNWPKLVAPELVVARTVTVSLQPLRREGALSLAAEQNRRRGPQHTGRYCSTLESARRTPISC